MHVNATAKREIIFDTETTGLNPAQDHRIIEVGAIEMIGGQTTGKSFHRFVNPMGKKVDPEAFNVHGISDDFLRDKPGFRIVVHELKEFIGDATLCIHNAPFDIGFLNAELARLSMPEFKNEVVDTLALANRLYPDQRNSLDALCRRLGVDNSMRTQHGALLDCVLLGEVYAKMMRYDQLSLEGGSDAAVIKQQARTFVGSAGRSALRVDVAPVVIPEHEFDLHREFVEKKLPNSVWNILGD